MHAQTESGEPSYVGRSSGPPCSAALWAAALAMLPTVTVGEQNHTNPFNPSSTIRYAVLHRCRVSLVVYNTLGQQVATLVDEVKRPGSYEVTLNASGLASGVYVYRLQAGAFVQARKMLLLTRYHLILTNGDRFQVSGVRNCQFQIADT
jgi:hypothetical protein